MQLPKSIQKEYAKLKFDFGSIDPNQRSKPYYFCLFLYFSVTGYFF